MMHLQRDEMEKIPFRVSCLLCIMLSPEAQAGLCATLPARTSVLAAANPAGLRFHQRCIQILSDFVFKIDELLISRLFSLV